MLEIWPWIVVVSSSGTGMLEAESIIFCNLDFCLNLADRRKREGGGWGKELTPFAGFVSPFPTASMILPRSSATSRIQSSLPVATIRCVSHRSTLPNSSSSSSMENLAGYFRVQESQSQRHSSPSTRGSVLGNSLYIWGFLMSSSSGPPGEAGREGCGVKRLAKDVRRCAMVGGGRSIECY